MSIGTHRGQKRVPDPLGAGVTGIVNPWMWVLGSDLIFSRESGNDLKC